MYYKYDKYTLFVFKNELKHLSGNGTKGDAPGRYERGEVTPSIEMAVRIA